MKKNSVIWLTFLSLIFTSCASTNIRQYFDVVDNDFGIMKNVVPYEINDTKLVTDKDVFKFHGRHFYNSNLNAEFFSFSSSGFEVTFTGTSLEGCFLANNANSDKDRPYLAVAIDNDYEPNHATPIRLTSTVNSNAQGYIGNYTIHPHVTLVNNLPYGEHTIRIYKRSEAPFSKVGIRSISTDGTIGKVKAKEFDLKMEFYGDSVTCGYGVEASSFYENFSTRTENSLKSYANYCANYLNADVSHISVGGYPIYRSKWSLNNKPDNIPDMFSLADIDWYTNNTVAWDNSKFIPDVVVIALGANDGSYLEDFREGSGQYNLAVSHYVEKYVAFIDTILNAYPSTQIVVSSEILDIMPIYEQKMDEIVTSYNAGHNLVKPILRVRYNAKNLSKDKSLPGNGHPNETMQHIAGRELAEILSRVLGKSIIDDGFTY